MASAQVTIEHPAGLHARPAALFVRAAAGFSSNITIANLSRNPEQLADAKSIITLMTLGIENGHLMLIEAHGNDEEDAVATLQQLIESNFGEASR